METATASHLESIVWKHLDTADWLWHQRRFLARSSKVSLGKLVQFEDRLRQHLAALGRYDTRAVPRAAESLVDTDGGHGFSSAWVLLRQPQAANVAAVVEATRKSEGQHRIGLFAALASNRRSDILPHLEAIAKGPTSVASALAMEALCRLGKANPIRSLLVQRLMDADAEITAILWTAAGLLPGGSIPRQAFDYVLTRSPADTEENNALEAAALHRQPWILDWCRRPSDVPAHQRARLRWLAVLGVKADGDALRRHRSLLKSEYHAHLALHGNPEHLIEIESDLGNPDPRISVRAGIAFQRLTGVNIEGIVRVELLPDDGVAIDEVGRAFQPSGFLPDQALAKQVRQSLAVDTRPDVRLIAGHMVDRDAPFPVAGDCEAAWGHGLRHWMNRENAARPLGDVAMVGDSIE